MVKKVEVAVFCASVRVRDWRRERKHTLSEVGGQARVDVQKPFHGSRASRLARFPWGLVVGGRGASDGLGTN